MENGRWRARTMSIGRASVATTTLRRAMHREKDGAASG